MTNLASHSQTSTTAVASGNQARYIALVSFIAAMGGLLFGYDWVVIGGAAPFYEAHFHLTDPVRIGWAMGSALIGCLIGALTAGLLSDGLGRKALLLTSGALFAISSILTGQASSYGVFILWRMLGGVAIGMASNISPVYIAEVAPARWRGRLVSLNQLAIVIGILLAQVINWRLAQPVAAGATMDQIAASWNGQWGWRWMFIAVAVPSVLFFLLAFLVPESPRWLVRKGRLEQARAVLARLAAPEDVAIELALIRETIGTQRVTLAELTEPRMLRLLIVGSLIAALSQWSGINVIFNYARQVFADAGYPVADLLFTIVITGVVNLVFTLIAMKTVDRWGRRKLFLAGCAGLALLHTLIGLGYFFSFKGPLMLLAVVMAIACYACTLAPVTWVLISEIYPNRIRGAATAVAVAVLWLACFALTYTFPILNRKLGAAGTFWVYATVCAAGFVFIFRCVPETQGKSLEQIEKDF